MTWAKTRWATLPTETIPKACLLEWVVESQGYTVAELDTAGASDAELEQRVAGYLADHPWTTTNAVLDGVKGTEKRIRKLLDGARFDSVNGPRGSILWNLASDCREDAAEVPRQ